MKHTTEAHVLITTFVGVTCLLIGFVMGLVLSFFKCQKIKKFDNKYHGKI